MNTRIKKTKIFRIVLLIITVLFGILAIYSIGKPTYLPWETSISLDNPSNVAVDTNGNIRGIVDSNGLRLISLDENQRIVGIKYKTSEPDSISYFKRVDFHNGMLYTSECFLDTDDNSIEKETVTSYQPNLNTGNVVYEVVNKEQNFDNPSILRLEQSNGHLYLICYNNNRDKLNVLDLDENDEIISQLDISNIKDGISACDYNKACDVFVAVAFDGSLYFKDNQNKLVNTKTPENLGAINTLAVSDNGEIYLALVADDGVFCYKNNKIFECIRGINPTHLSCGTDLYLCDTLDSTIKIYRENLLNQQLQKVLGSTNDSPIYEPSSSFSSFSFSPEMYLTYLLIWISYLWLFVVVLFASLFAIKKIVRSNQIHKLSIVCTSVLAASAVVLIAIYFSSATYNQYYSFYKYQTQAVSASISNTISKNYKTYENSEKTEASFVEFISQTSRDLEVEKSKMDYVGFGSELDAFIEKDSERIFINPQFTISSDKHSYINGLWDKYKDNVDREVGQLSSDDSFKEGYIVGYATIKNSEGSTIGVAECSTLLENVTIKQYSYLKDFMVAILAIGGVLVLVVLELRAFFKMLSKRARDIGTDKFPEIWATRGLAFFCCMSSGFDCTISVLIAKDMLMVKGIEDPVLFGLPAMFSCIGITLGTMLSTYLAQNIPGRRLAITCLVPSIVLNLVTVWAVACNYFWLFCILKFVTDLILNSYSRSLMTLPLRTSNEKRRAKVTNETNMAYLSSNAIGGILAGFVATYLGDCYVYLFAAAPLVFCIVYCLVMLPKKTVFAIDAKKSKKFKLAPALKMMISPQMIGLYIFGLLASLLAYNYKSILFPLFASDTGLTKVEINNIIVLANVLIFALTPVISKKYKHLDHWYIMLGALILEGIVLVVTGINSNIIWGFVILFITGYAHRAVLSCVMILWPREAAKRGVSKAGGAFCAQTLMAILDTAKTPLLSSLVGFGQIAVCCGVGIWTLISGAGFSLLSYRSALRKKPNNYDTYKVAKASSKGAVKHS